MKLIELICPNCGGNLEVSDDGLARCIHCGTVVVLEEEKKTNINIKIYEEEKDKIEKRKEKRNQWIYKFLIQPFCYIALFIIVGAVVINVLAEVQSHIRQDKEDQCNRLFLSDVFHKPYKEITKEEKESIKFLSVDFDTDQYIYRYSLLDYATCESESEFQKSIIVWKKSDGIPLSEDFSDFSGMVRFEYGMYGLKDLIFSKSLNLKYLSCWEPMNDIISTLSVDQIEVLIAEGCGESLYGLEKFKKLKDLTVNCYSLKNIRSLSQCENLLRLNLKSSLLTDFDVLSKLKNLEELIIDCEELKTLDFVKNMKQLHTLNVLSGLLLDVEALKNKDSLENLYLADKFEITDYTPIGTLSNLNQLTMYTDTSDIKSFKELQKLTYLNVSGIWDFSEFSYMVDLKELTLSSSAYETIHLLKENKKLESIMIYEGLWLRSFDFASLADIENLRKLHLNGDEDTACYHIDCVLNKDTLEDFKLVGAKIYLNKELLKKNLNLKEIYLELITIVKNGDDESYQEEKLSEALGFLAHYPNIERLSVIGSKLNSIECVKSLSHLRELEVTDNYISDFSVLNTLKEFDHLICKKMQQLMSNLKIVR